MKKRDIIIITLVVLVSSNTNAADRYVRKSISFVEAVWLMRTDIWGIKQWQVNYMLDAITREIEMPRFDYNPLPPTLIRDFVDAANSRKNLSVNDTEQLMEKYLLPKILQILEATSQERAESLVSEAQKHSFLVTKAKELGITLEEIETVMNSAYLYLPIITSLDHEYDETKERYTYTLHGGILWYHVNTGGEKPTIDLMSSETTFSKGFGSKEVAFEAAADNLARNLRIATQNLSVFKLSAPITEAWERRIAFPLGTREGLKLDDTYLVGEWMFGEGVKADFVKTGWVKVGKVGDNLVRENAVSTAWAVRYSEWAPGMTVIEHPRLGIDIAFKPGGFYSAISKGRVPILLSHSGEIKITKDYEAYVPGFDIDAHFNIAPYTGVAQQFLIVGGNLALPATLEFESDLFTMLSSTPPYIWGFHVGFLQKKYLGQFAFTGDAKIGMRFMSVDQEFRFFGRRYVYSVSNNTFGVQFDLGLDYAFTPDLNIGFSFGYRLFPVSSIWSQKLEPAYDGALIDWDDRYPEINHTGPCYMLYLHFSPPELPFDPINYLLEVVLD